MTEKRKKEIKGMFGNYVFPLFSIFKNNFLFLKLKNLFGNPKWIENKNCSQNSICEGNWKYAKKLFSVSSFQKSIKIHIWFNESVSFNELALKLKF